MKKQLDHQTNYFSQEPKSVAASFEGKKKVKAKKLFLVGKKLLKNMP